MLEDASLAAGPCYFFLATPGLRLIRWSKFQLFLFSEKNTFVEAHCGQIDVQWTPAPTDPPITKIRL